MMLSVGLFAGIFIALVVVVFLFASSIDATGDSSHDGDVGASSSGVAEVDVGEVGDTDRGVLVT